VITQFLKLETLLDDSVSKNIELQIERGGTSKTLTLLVRFFILGYLLLSKDNLVEYDLTYGFRGWRWWLFQ
ncbi:hypothetical protein PHAVU_008G087400, partial [Phaseolus vulgaris]